MRRWISYSVEFMLKVQKERQQQSQAFRIWSKGLFHRNLLQSMYTIPVCFPGSDGISIQCGWDEKSACFQTNKGRRRSFLGNARMAIGVRTIQNIGDNEYITESWNSGEDGIKLGKDWLYYSVDETRSSKIGPKWKVKQRRWTLVNQLRIYSREDKTLYTKDSFATKYETLQETTTWTTSYGR